MIIRAIDAGLDAWIARRVTPPRSQGQHVSVILTDMLKSLPGNRYEAWGKMRDGEDRKPEWEAGYLWEDVLAKALSDRHAPNSHGIEAFELELDGIFGTPDRLYIEPLEGIEQSALNCRWVDEEVKFTWMSCKELLHDPTQRPTCDADWKPEGLTADVKFTYWLLQSKTYAAMLYLGAYVPCIGIPVKASEPAKAWYQRNPDLPSLTVPITRVRALFINGTYKGELAIPGAWEIEYTPEELTTWWANVKHHAEQMRMRESEAPTVPEF